MCTCAFDGLKGKDGSLLQKGAFGRAHHCTNVRGVKKGVPAGAGLKECGVHALITGTPLWARNMGKAP